MKPEVREMVICYFMKVPEVERQVHDKYAKFTKDHVFHEFPFAGAFKYTEDVDSNPSTGRYIVARMTP